MRERCLSLSGWHLHVFRVPEGKDSLPGALQFASLRYSSVRSEPRAIADSRRGVNVFTGQRRVAWSLTVWVSALVSALVAAHFHFLYHPLGARFCLSESMECSSRQTYGGTL